jgi:16S rRNA (cytidine1402-2'-O)-methyltransferase
MDSRRGRLLVVGTPIGNMDDLSPRASKALAGADAIFCEDTRVTAKLAARFGWTAARISCPAPREASRVEELLERLRAGQTIALVTDAGMPAISDPGRELVAAAAGAGFRVDVVPGPSAISAALALSGLRAVPHYFAGFLPARAGERRRALEDLAGRAETLVWFEAPHRLLASLEDAAAVFGARRACVARELTKIHEEAVYGTLPELAAIFRERQRGRGEATVVVEGNADSSHGKPPGEALSDAELDRKIAAAVASGKAKRAIAREMAAASGRPAREIYARAVALAQKTRRGKP